MSLQKPTSLTFKCSNVEPARKQPSHTSIELLHVPLERSSAGHVGSIGESEEGVYPPQPCTGVGHGFGLAWPTHGLSELLLPQAALCEWRLLGPALPELLADKGSRVYLVAPPKTPLAMGLAQLGLAPEQLVWIDAKGPAERLWAAEQLIKSEPDGAVIAWLPQARQDQIRRLLVHAHACDAPVFLIRLESALRDASPAPLRLSVSLGQG